MNKIEKIYFSLLKKYGKPQGQWSLWCKRPKTLEEKERIIIESILTQRANWNNVQMAIENLKRGNVSSLKKIRITSMVKIALLIKPSGFYQQKSERLKRTADFFISRYKDIEEASKVELSILRKELLSLNGIGDETADDILLYALEKPSFVIDEYTRRLVLKEKITDTRSYKNLQELFETNLKSVARRYQGYEGKEYVIYQDFHALIVIDGKESLKNFLL
ncbi:hypothetical protein B9J78_02775 [bacterium Unc6]|nr:hypothetical protein [bacterium Unc6]